MTNKTTRADLERRLLELARNYRWAWDRATHTVLERVRTIADAPPGHPMTIVGVTPKDFNGVTVTHRPYVFIPMTMRAVMSPTARPIFERRNNYWVYAFARLKPGVSIDRARVALNEKYKSVINDIEAPLQTDMSPETMTRFRAKQVSVEPGRIGQSNMERNAKTPLLFLLAPTFIVLLIACANIANLLLTHAAARNKEIAIR